MRLISYSCYCSKHGNSKAKCHNLHINVHLILFVSVQRTAQTSARVFIQTRIMVDSGKFISHDNGDHFQKSTIKNDCCKKCSNIFVTKLKLQVRLSMQWLHRHRYTLLKNLILFFDKNQGRRLKLSSTPLSHKKWKVYKKSFWSQVCMQYTHGWFSYKLAERTGHVCLNLNFWQHFP